VRALAVPLLALVAGLAQAQSEPDGIALLRRIQQATQRLSYSGIFVYQRGERSETSRITRYVGPAGVVEKLETLDGVPREIVRTRDSIRCYLPKSHVVKIERRTGTRAFPGLLPDELGALARHYAIRRDGRARVAGLDCDAVLLAPRDELRYGHRLCADVRSGMLLKARIQDALGRLVEQFTFTEIAIGGVPRGRVRLPRTPGDWRVEESAAAPADLAAAGWQIDSDLPGFRKIAEVRRRLHASDGVGQVVYSDGLAALSVFIEPLAGQHAAVRPGLSSLGAINIVTREVSDHLVTVLGEAPAVSVQRLARRVAYHAPQ
jgi:sigma-E factor negative regulatory protein RseB